MTNTVMNAIIMAVAAFTTGLFTMAVVTVVMIAVSRMTEIARDRKEEKETAELQAKAEELKEEIDSMETTFNTVASEVIDRNKNRSRQLFNDTDEAYVTVRSADFRDVVKYYEVEKLLKVRNAMKYFIDNAPRTREAKEIHETIMAFHY